VKEKEGGRSGVSTYQYGVICSADANHMYNHLFFSYHSQWRVLLLLNVYRARGLSSCSPLSPSLPPAQPSHLHLPPKPWTTGWTSADVLWNRTEWGSMAERFHNFLVTDTSSCISGPRPPCTLPSYSLSSHVCLHTDCNVGTQWTATPLSQ